MDDKRKAIKPTEEEEQEREDYAFDLLSQCFHKSQIKKKFIGRYEVTARTVERYLSRARARMSIQASVARDDLRAESLAFYQTILRDKEAQPRDKILARQRIDSLFGLDAPAKVALDGAIEHSVIYVPAKAASREEWEQQQKAQNE